MRKRREDFSEKKYGYGGFSQFVKAAEARGYVQMVLDESGDEFVVQAVNGDAPASAPDAEPAAAPEEEPKPATKRKASPRATEGRILSRTSVRRKPKPPKEEEAEGTG